MNYLNIPPDSTVVRQIHPSKRVFANPQHESSAAELLRSAFEQSLTTYAQLPFGAHRIRHCRTAPLDRPARYGGTAATAVEHCWTPPGRTLEHDALCAV